MSKEIPWYSEEAGFFGEFYLHNYEDIITEERTQQEVNFIEKVLGLQPGAKIFDLCCGHGRHSVELAKRGYNVTGQDLNGYFLKIAGESAKKAGVNIKWIKDDMRNIACENEFDAVLNLFTAFGYLGSDDEEQKVIDGVSRSLKQNGKFILDIINRDRIIRQFLSKDHRYLPDGSIEITDRKLDHISGSNKESRKTVWPDGKIQEFETEVRMFTIPEIAAMFRRAGLQLIESFGDYLSGPVNFSSPRYILIAEKK